MSRAMTLCILALAACTAEELPYPWFERDWVSDRESTLAANDRFQDMAAEELENLLADYGNLHWRVDGYTLEAIYPSEPAYNLQSEFSLEAIDESSFLLLTEFGANFTITGNARGFCAKPEDNAESAECFVPRTD